MLIHLRCCPSLAGVGLTDSQEGRLHQKQQPLVGAGMRRARSQQEFIRSQSTVRVMDALAVAWLSAAPCLRLTAAASAWALLACPLFGLLMPAHVSLTCSCSSRRLAADPTLHF